MKPFQIKTITNKKIWSGIYLLVNQESLFYWAHFVELIMFSELVLMVSDLFMISSLTYSL